MSKGHQTTAEESRPGGRRKYRLRRRLFNMMSSAEKAGAAHNHSHICEHDEEVEQIGRETEELQKQLQEAREAALRSRADLENQRKRHAKEKDELRRYANETLLRELVPALDHFALAIQSFESATDVHSLRQGVTMIQREIIGVLQSSGLGEVAPLDEPFDPALHEAVATDTVRAKGDGVVLEVLRPGWQLNGRIIRPAMVKVNKL